jgi:hypothetical protein
MIFFQNLFLEMTMVSLRVQKNNGEPSSKPRYDCMITEDRFIDAS